MYRYKRVHMRGMALAAVLATFCLPSVTALYAQNLVVDPSGTLTVTEGGEVTFRVSFDQSPLAGRQWKVMITASDNDPLGFFPDITFGVSPQSLSFDATGEGSQPWNTQQEVTLTASDNEDIGDNPGATVTLEFCLSGTCNSTTSTETIDIVVEDDDVPELEIDENLLELTEGAGATERFRVKLTKEPASDVTVTLTQESDDILSTTARVDIDVSTITFTKRNGPDKWSKWSPVDVTAPDNDNVEGNGFIKIILSASGGGADGATEEVFIDYTDDDVPELEIDRSDLELTEGAGATERFRVKLTKEPASDVTVTLTQESDDHFPTTARVDTDVSTITFTKRNGPDKWSKWSPVNVTAPDNDDIEGSGLINIVLSASGGGADGVTEEVTIEYTDDDEPILVLNPDEIDPFPEGSSVTFTGALDKEPTGEVTVALSLDDGYEGDVVDSDISISPSTLTFNTTTWSVPQTVTVAHADNSTIETSGEIDVVLTPSGGGVAETDYVTLIFEDNDTPRLVLDPDEIDSFPEGGTATFVVDLDKVPNGEVTVTLSLDDGYDDEGDVVDSDISISPPTLTFNTTTWNVPQTVTVTHTDNSTIEASGEIYVDVTPSGGGVTEAPYVTLDFEDNDTPLLVLDPERIDPFPEGSTATFVVDLDKVPNGEVTVTLSLDDGYENRGDVVDGDISISPPTLTFNTTTWNVPQTVTVMHTDNTAIEPSGAIYVDVTPSGGGVTEADYVILIFEDNDAPRLVLDPDEIDSFPEGGTATFVVDLDKVPNGEVTVTLSLDDGYDDEGDVVDSDISISPPTLTFNTTTWNVPQTVTVTHTDNSTIEASGEIYVDVTPSGGGVTEAPYVTLDFEDNDTPLLVLDPERIDPFPEGSTATFVVDLDKVPNGEVTVTLSLDDGYENRGDVVDGDISISPPTLTFNTTTWNVPQTVTVMHTDNTAIEPSGAIYVDVTPSGGGVTEADYVILIFEDNDAPRLVLDPDEIDSFPEGGSAMFAVDLDKVPTGEVTVTLSLDDGYDDEGDVVDSDISISPPTLTFNTTTWNVPQTVTVTHTDNSTIEASGEIYVDVTPSGGGVTEAPYVTLIFEDNDAPRLVLDPDEIDSFPEGGSAMFAVDLDKVPTGEVTVTLSLDDGYDDEGDVVDSDISISPPTLTFNTTTWNVPQTVTVTHTDNSTIEASGEIYVDVTPSGGGVTEAPYVTLIFEDNDTPFLVLDPRGINPFPEGSSATFDVDLDKVPTGEVTVTLSLDDGYSDEGDVVDSDISISPATLTFNTTTWNMPQTVMVTHMDNSTIEASGEIYVDVIPSGGGVTQQDYVTLEFEDNDTAILVLDPDEIDSFPEGGSAMFAVDLDKVPTGEVTVTLSLDDGYDDEGDVVDSDISISPPTLTFNTTTWNVPQTVTVTHTDNSTIEASGEIYVDAIPSGGGVTETAYVTLIFEDNDTPSLVLAPERIDPFPEGGSVTFAVDLDKVPNGEVTVTFSLDDGYGEGDVVDSDISISPATLTFNTGTWNVPQTVTVAHADNSTIEPSGEIDIVLTPSGGGVTEAAYVTLIFEDNDTPLLVLDPDEIDSFPEGGSATFAVDLDKVPNGEVTVTLLLDDGYDGEGDVVDSDISISPATLTFNTGTWNVPQVVTVMHTDNTVIEPSGWIYVDASPSGGGVTEADYVTLIFEDNDTPILVLDPDIIDPFPEGSSATFAVDLDKVPNGEVTVTLSLDDGYENRGDVVDSDISISPATLTFNTGTWNVPQEVTVAHADNSTIETSGWIYVDMVPRGGGVRVTEEDYVVLNFEDNDRQPIELYVFKNPVDEGDAFTIQVLFADLEVRTTDTMIPLAFANIDAEDGDYQILSSLTIPANATVKTQELSANEDSDKDDEVFTVALDTDHPDWPPELDAVNPSPIEVTIEDDDKLLTVDITGVPSPINSTDAFTATFTFSEPVTGFETGDVVVTGGNKGAFTAVNATEYTLEVTPSGGADVVVTVAADAATDGLNTGPSSAESVTAVWDATALTVDITGVPDKINNSTSAFTATFTFSEPVTGFETGDVSITGGTGSGFSGSGDTYTLVVTPAGGADVVVTVAADAATDGLNTGPSSEESVTAVWDATAPTVDITGVPSPINSTDAFTATFTFSEPVTGFATGDVSITGGTGSGFSGSGDTYTLEVTPDGGADVVVTVTADAATDGLNTGPSSEESVTAVWDAAALTVDITGVPSPISSTSAFTATFTFSKDVTGFETGDVGVTGGNKGAFTAVSASEYTLVVTPSGGADVVVTVAADAATDGLNTGPSSEESVTAVWDATALTVDITGVPSPINSTDAFTATFTFSEPVTGFETGDVVVTGGNKGAFSAVNASEYTLVITPAGGADVVVTVAAGAATDGLNTGPSSAVTATAVWDAAAPSLDITGVPSLINSTSAFTATFTFSKSVTDFETGDVVVTGGSKGTFSAVNASEYTLVITPDGGADVVVTVTADAATDGLNTGPSSEESVTAVWDATALTVDITGVPSPINSTDAFTATFTFSEPVTGFETGDVVVTGGNKGAFTAVNATEYTLEVTPSGGADVVVTVAADAATDGLNTGPSSAESVTAVWDATALTVDITGVPDKINNSTSAFTATFTFSEPVTGFETGDVVVTGGNKGAFSAVNASEYTLVITPAGGADVVVTVAAGAATDGLNTGPSSAVTATAVWDAAAPSLDITGVPSLINSTSAFTATFTFSKSVTDFETGDVVVTGGSKGTFSAVNASEYTLVITPDGGADVVVTVTADAATDGLNTGPSSAVTATAVWDAAAPSLDITGVPSLINSTSAFTATFTFSKSVTDFETGDVVVTGGSKGTFSAVNASEYTLVITPDGGADVVVTVTADAATDGLNTGPSSEESVTAVWDATALTVDITGVPSPINSTDAFTATFTFSEPVTGFETGDVVVTGGNKGAFSAVNASEYTLVITPAGGADVVVTVAAGAATDGLNTGPSSAESVTAVWDATAPTVDITGVPSPINSTDAFTATFTFSKSVTDFETGDVVVTGGNKGAFTAVNATEYTLEVTPSGGADVVVTVAAGAATDGLNTGPSSAVTATAVWDAAAPSLDITGVPSLINSTSAFTATFTFSKSVTDFETGDVVVTGGSKGTFSAVNASEYTLVITPDGGADVVVTVTADAATDGLNTGPSSAVTATAVWDAAAPSLDITGVPSLINSTSAFTATFTFSKSVTDFETGDVVVTGGSKGTFSAVNASEYTLVITPDGGADVVVTVTADAATDGLNTGPSSEESVTAVWDATALTVDITGVPSPINSTDAFTATFTFSEPVTGFETGDVVVTGGNKGAFTAVNATEYTLEVTPSGGADVVVTVAADAATDGLNTGPSSAESVTAVWDATAPTVDITGVPSPINSTDAFTATFTFSEPVTGFETGDVVVTGGNKGAFSAVNASEYTLVITPAGGADVVVTVAAGAATDGLNTGPSSAVTATAVWDAAAPSLDITGVPSLINSTSAFTATFTFSKSVTDFETGDVVVTGGNKGAFTAVNATEYTLEVTPSGGADVVVTVAADAATDGLNTGPSSAESVTAVWDATAPTVDITGVPSPINSTDAFTATFTFSEPVTGFETGDVGVTGGNKGAFTAVSASEYTLVVTPSGGADVIVTVAAGAATDGLNTGPSSAVTATAVWDATAPTVDITGVPSPINSTDAFTATFTFSEPVTGFETGDVVVTGGNKGAFTAVNATEYTLVVTPSGGADVVVTVAADAATDGLNTGPSSEESVTAVWDAAALTVDITGVPSPISSTSAFTATFTFSKDVTGFETGDVGVTGGSKGAFSAVSAAEYTLVVTPAGGADVVVTVAADAATDGLNTGPSSAVTATAVWDATAPSVAITGVPDKINSTDAFTATFTFDEAVTGFETGDVEVTGGSKGAFTAVNTVEYTLEVTPTGGSDVVVTVAADAATDGLNTGPSSAVTATAVWDAAPMVTLSASPLSVVEGGTITVTATLSEELPNPVTIDLTDTHVTTEPADYVPLVSITIAGGELTGSGDLVTVDDDIAESDETFTLALGDLPAGLAPGDPSLVELTILDDGDIPPPAEVSLSVDPEEIDEGGSITVVLQLSEVLTTDVVVPLTYPPGTTAEPEDYTALGSVTIPGGQNTGTGQIATVVDTDTEDETFIVALGSLPLELVAGRETSQLVTIRDIFPPRDVRLHLSATPNPVDEGDEVTLTVELAEALLTAVTIPLVLTDITADGQDYRASSPAQVEIEAGGTRGTYVVSILQDHVAEGSETFTVAFGTLPDGVVDGDPPEEVKVTIMDDDEAGIDAPPLRIDIGGKYRSLRGFADLGAPGCGNADADRLFGERPDPDPSESDLHTRRLESVPAGDADRCGGS